MVVHDVQTQPFDEIIKGNIKIVAIDFSATWCGPCKFISPVFEKLSEHPELGDIAFYKIDVDDRAKIAEEVGIRAMPTFMIFKDGEKVDELVGANPKKLEEMIMKYSK